MSSEGFDGTEIRQPDSTEDTAQQRPRFVVGIDLGTTNSALCFIDTLDSGGRIECFGIPQVVAVGEAARRETLPSFHYELLPEEVTARIASLPWHRNARGEDTNSYVVGQFARDHGRLSDGRMIESAKSWLCHQGVDRRAALLPWHGDESVQRLSPVEASARFLRHLRDAWDAAHSAEPLHQQDVVLTIPASFDEVARELTVAAARSAGLPRIVLIEEPQAAFYSWVYMNHDSWEQLVSPGQKILVCDIGGGTTDFSLIHVRSAADGRLQFHRVAVGDHLLLGGDNLDLALAHAVERRLMGEGQLTPHQWRMLIPACRQAKEILLAEDAPSTHTIVVSSGGARLIGGSLQLEITRDDLVQLVTEGFLPSVRLEEKPIRHQSGFQEFGLPYAADPAITRQLAAFLLSAAHGDNPADSSNAVTALAAAKSRPDIILFNGGFFASPILRSRLTDAVRQWFHTGKADWSPLVLQNDRLDLAVARGAAYFGMVRRGMGVRIIAGLARTYYVGVDQADGSQMAMCLIAAGTEPSPELTVIDREFSVRTSEPVEFPILVSGSRLTDQPGQLIPFDPQQMSALPPIRTVLTTRRRNETQSVRAKISVRLTEIGTLEIWCQQLDENRRWQLQFDVRSVTETDREAHTGTAERSGIVDSELLQSAQQVIRSVFQPGSSESPDGIARRIGAAIGMSRQDWPPSLLRGLWSELIDLESCRQRSPNHESRWLNLAGFCLRPGFGMAADDWRVDETWRVLKGRLVHGGTACLTEWRVLCRRISGGLGAGRQTQLASSVISAIRQKHRQIATGRGKSADYASSTHEAAEIWRMLGSFERLDQSVRHELGQIILDLIPRPASEPTRPALLWALGRIAARVPVYGPLNLVLSPDTVSPWIRRILDCCDVGDAMVQLALMQMSRRTHDRFREIDESFRTQIVAEFERCGGRPHLLQLIREGGTLESEEADQIVGESLPRGLRIC